jgi:Holliday junction DNA helicase RuvA
MMYSIPMFNSIRGTITAKLAGSVYILSGGIEWDIAVPATDIARLPPEGREGRVFTWLYHREDQMKLFGFAGEERRATFLELLKVDGVGPRGALKIMGGIGQEELERALDSEDLARLEAVPGLGKKTAQKMILALKGKLARAEALETASPYGDLAEALAGMGYDKRAAAEALARADRETGPDLTGEEREKVLFKQAIVYLSSS